MKLNILGQMFGTDGYSNHTRQFANALYDEGVDVSLSVNLPEGWQRNVNDNELKMIKKDSRDCDINLMIGMPQFWPMYMCEDKKFIGFCVFEGDKIPEYWIDILMDERVEQIWVPSKHVKEAIENTLTGLLWKGDDEPFLSGHLQNFIRDKIKIVPHGVDSKLFYPLDKHDSKCKCSGCVLHKKDESVFTFLTNKGFTSINDRGGTQYLIKAYLEEFTPEDNVDLLVKLNPAYGVPDMDKIIEQLDIQNNNLPKFKISTENIPYNKMNSLYNMGDVFVAPTRGEAFHLGCIEALACGLPVITTSYGGQTDFVDSTNGRLLIYKLEEVDFDNMYEGISWATPDIDDLRKEMRWCYENQDKVKELRSKCLETAKEYSWTNSAKIAVKCMKEL